MHFSLWSALFQVPMKPKGIGWVSLNPSSSWKRKGNMYISITQERNHIFFLGRRFLLGKYPIPLGKSQISESYRIHFPSWSCPAVVTGASLYVANSLGCCLTQEASNPGLVVISSKKVSLRQDSNQQLLVAFSPEVYLTHTGLFCII